MRAYKRDARRSLTHLAISPSQSSAVLFIAMAKRASAANGFGVRSLRVEEAWLLYSQRYPKPPDQRVPSGGWRMAPNGIPVPPVPRPGSSAWTEQVLFHRRRLTAEERASPLWRSHNNDAGWLGVFQARWEKDMRDTEGLNAEGRDRWWSGEGRTLDAVLNHIRAGGERLEMPPSTPPSPPVPLACTQWQLGRTTTASSSSRSSSSGPARSSSRSAPRASPYATPPIKREPASPPRRNRARGIVINDEPRRAAPPVGHLRLRRPKPEKKKEDYETNLAAYLEKQRMMAAADDPKDTPGLGTATMLSRNDHSGWVGSIDDGIAASLADAGKPFLDLTKDDAEAGPSRVKDENDGDEEPGSSAAADRRWFRRYGGY